MNASGEKTARIIRLPLKQGEWLLPTTQGDGTTAERRIVGARIAAFLAALVFGFAAWLPWLVITYHFGQSAQSITVDGGTLAQAAPFFVSDSYRLARTTPNTLHLMAIFGGVWAALSAAGVLLAPLLWLRPHTRSVRFALTSYGAWLLLAAAYTLAMAKVIFFPPDISGGEQSQWSPAWGMWIALAALVTGVSSLVALMRYDRSSPRVSGPRTPSPIIRTRAAWIGLGLLTVGILLWGLGFMAIPWATVNCPVTPITLNHFVSGRCAALDSGDALSYFATRTLPREAWNLAGGIYPLYGVLVGGGLFVLIAQWRTSPSRVICAWATLWLAGVSAVAYLAYRGVGVILTVNPVMSAEAQGIWAGASGVTTTLLGLLLAWLGIIPLERAAASAAPSPAAITPSTATAEAPLHLLASEDDEFEVTSLR
ncbi:MAG: hypothetical protein ACXVDA_03435 [Ktedonobacterales bacterium]